jgi:hypothetical protein
MYRAVMEEAALRYRKAGIVKIGLRQVHRVGLQVGVVADNSAQAEKRGKVKKMINKFGKLITASFIIMGIGIVTFPLVFPLYELFGIDYTSWFSYFIFLVGAIICIVGLIRRKSFNRIVLITLLILVSIMCIPISFGVVSLICYFITGKELGS